MLRSMYAGVAGLKSHQIRMDVIGNNISNVNTIGFKKGRVNFYDTLYQSMKGSAAPTTNLGGVNGQAVGLGAAIASVDTITTSGSTQTTNKMSDLMIQGNGYFVLKGDSIDRYYTRAGNFDFDPTGKFVNTSNGMQVMGYMFDTATGDFSNNLEAININGVKTLDPKATTGLILDGNLDASKLPSDNAHPITQDVYDSKGNKHTLVINMDKTYGMVPAAPTFLTVVDGVTNTFDWTITPGFPATGNYEFSLDVGNTWTNCTGKPQTIFDADYAAGSFQVRVKADPANGYTSGTPLVSTGPFTATAGGANAPASITVDDTANTFTWANEGATYTDNADYEYSTNFGASWTPCGANRTISLGDINLAAGALAVRVRQNANGAGIPATAGTIATSTTGLTSSTAAPATTLANTWRMDISLDGSPLTITGGNLFASFDNSGNFTGVRQATSWGTTVDTFTLANLNYGGGVDPGNITLDFTGLTEYAQASTAWAGKMDAYNPEALGFPGGTLDSYTIDQSGIITGVYSNDVTRQLAQLGSATFDNAAGLKQIGSNLFQVTNNSGGANEGKVGTGDRGNVSPGTLEMSNVDLSEEFTNMITTQRGFQANSRIITTSDQMLEELLSLKR